MLEVVEKHEEDVRKQNPLFFTKADKMNELNNEYFIRIQGKSFNEALQIEMQMQAMERFIMAQTEVEAVKGIDIAKELQSF